MNMYDDLYEDREELAQRELRFDSRDLTDIDAASSDYDYDGVDEGRFTMEGLLADEADEVEDDELSSWDDGGSGVDNYTYDEADEADCDRESWRVMSRHKALFTHLAKRGSSYDRRFLQDARQQSWIEAAFLESRRERTGNSRPLFMYLRDNMPDRIRVNYDKWKNTVELPEHHRKISQSDRYSKHAKNSVDAITDTSSNRQPFINYEDWEAGKLDDE